jgi:hypothetical protein
MDHFARDVGEPEVSAAVKVRQPGVIEAERVEHRGVQVETIPSPMRVRGER